MKKINKKQTLKYEINLDHSKNENLSESGKAMLLDRYLLDDETYQDLFARVATHYADNQNHAQRLYYYMSDFWFMPATPVLSNGGAKRGLPISCFLNRHNPSISCKFSLQHAPYINTCPQTGLGFPRGGMSLIRFQ